MIKAHGKTKQFFVTVMMQLIMMKETLLHLHCNFKELELKKLICTHFSGVVDLFNQGAKGYVLTKDGFNEFKNFPEGYTGSFDDPLSLKILNEEADIVCTNPPFSRATDYWRILIASGKKFFYYF